MPLLVLVHTLVLRLALDGQGVLGEADIQILGVDTGHRCVDSIVFVVFRHVQGQPHIAGILIVLPGGRGIEDISHQPIHLVAHRRYFTDGVPTYNPTHIVPPYR